MLHNAMPRPGATRKARTKCGARPMHRELDAAETICALMGQGGNCRISPYQRHTKTRSLWQRVAVFGSACRSADDRG
jgi:hypothetical protein